MDDITYDVRMYKTRVYKGARATTYTVRWKVAGKEWTEPHRHVAQAEGFHAELATAVRRGEAFRISTGRPISWRRDEGAESWLSFTVAYLREKWPFISPNHRRSIVEALVDASDAVYPAVPNGPSRTEIRTALREWLYSAHIRDKHAQPPAEFSDTVSWMRRHKAAITDFTTPGTGQALTHAVMDRLNRKQDGTPAAPNTSGRKRTIIKSLFEHARVTGQLDANPLRDVKASKRRTVKAIDPRVVVNPDQARALLSAVKKQGARGERMVAFFACLYYAGLRPEEAVDLRRENITHAPVKGWGELRLSHAYPRPGRKWTDNGHSRERRQLKHREPGDVRPVPAHPDLVRWLRWHIEENGTAPDGRLFVGPRGGWLAEWAYYEVWSAARKAALSPAEAASPLVETPYALRHAAVSTWLAAGVPAPQVAEWAGHSVEVLLRVYAKCIAGQQDEAKRRIEDTMRAPEDPSEAESDENDD